MRKRVIILMTIIGLTLLLSFLLVFLEHKFEEAKSPGVTFIFSNEDYVYRIILSTIILIIPAFILGFISWFLLKKKKLYKVTYFIGFNLVGLIFLLYSNSREIFKIWHYNKFQANINYNESLTKRNGDYVDTCMLLVQKDIKSHGLSANDFRILTYSYEEGLATIPMDKTNKFYSFEVIYSKADKDTKSVRAAKYFFDFNGRIKKVYDVDAKDEKAKTQIEALKQNFKDLKYVLEKFPDSLDNKFDELKKKLKPID